MALRTPKQNNSLHLYCEQLSDALNDAGFERRAVEIHFREGIDVPWTKESVKDWARKIGKIMFDVDSTAKLTTTQAQEVYRVLDARFSEITGVHIEWPSEERLRWEYEVNLALKRER